MRRDRIASVVTALALVLAAVGGGLGPMSATQTASAEFKNCSFNDSIISAGLSTLAGDTSGCYWDPGLGGDTENITATDAYATSLGIKDSTDNYLTTLSNFNENSRTVAYSKAKIATVQGLENVTSESVVKNDANSSSDDYYSRQQISVINDWNAKAEQLRYLNSTGLTTKIGTDSTRGLLGAGDYSYNYTLVNGTTVQVELLTEIYASQNYEPNYYWGPLAAREVPNGYVSGASTDGIGHPDNSPKYAKVVVNDPETSETTKLFNVSRYSARLVEIEDQAQQVRDNMDQYVSGVYSQYNAGELNATTIAQNDPTLIATEASTSFNSTGYYGYAAASLASIGAAGDLNQSHVVSINGANYTGTLFYNGDQTPELQTGETYSFSNFSGTWYMAASSTPTNETGIIRLDNRGGDTFTVESATNTQTGEAVNTTTTQRYVYETANASTLAEEVDRLEELREFYQEQASASGGVGINLGTDDKAIIGVLAVAVILLLTRD